MCKSQHCFYTPKNRLAEKEIKTDSFKIVTEK